MEKNESDLSQRYMLLIKQDAYNLYTRIKERESEYVVVFSLKRDRSIFKEIFFNRYKNATMHDLSHLPLEVIEATNDFYQEADELYWYLMNTQDMPNTIEDEVTRRAHTISFKYDNLCIAIDGEVSDAPPLPSDEVSSMSFSAEEVEIPVIVEEDEVEATNFIEDEFEATPFVDEEVELPDFPDEIK